MPTLTSDICIGSSPNLPAQTMSVTANAVTEDVVLPARSYYLDDGVSAFGLVYRLGANLTGHSELLGGVTCVVQRDLRVRIESDAAVAFTLTWPTDGVLRDLLGFTGNLTPAATSHTATSISPLIWSAGRTASYRARLGTDGVPVHDTMVGQSAPGTVRATSYNSYRTNTVTWRYVSNARVWTTDEEGGEFYAFWDQCLRRLAHFKIYRGTVEDSASTTAITLGTVLPSSGAYVLAPQERVGEMPWDREFKLVESSHPIELPVVTTPEYT